MKGFGVSLFMFFFLPALLVQAETEDFRDTSGSVPPEFLSKQNPAPNAVEIPYAFAKLTLNKGPAKIVKVYHPPLPPADKSFSFVKSAEAFVKLDELTIRQLENICNKINEARSIEDLESFLSDTNIQLLRKASTEGASESVIVAMIQSMRPQNIFVVDAAVHGRRITLSVTGQSEFGPMNGMILMINTDGAWKIDHEEWYAGYDNYHEIYNPLSITVDQEQARPQQNLLAAFSSNYKTSNKFLSLTKVPYTREKQAFTFIYVMNKGRSGPKRSALTKHLEANGVISKPRPYVHLLWTGSKKILKNQHLIKNQYPMDVSIAPADDGFAAGEWNVILPKKRPRELRVALMWAF